MGYYTWFYDMVSLAKNVQEGCVWFCYVWYSVEECLTVDIACAPMACVYLHLEVYEQMAGEVRSCDTFEVYWFDAPMAQLGEEDVDVFNVG